MDQEIAKLRELMSQCGLQEIPTEDEIKANADMIQTMLQNSGFNQNVNPDELKNIDWLALLNDVQTDVQQQLPQLVELYSKVRGIIEGNPKLVDLIDKIKSGEKPPEEYVEELKPEFPAILAQFQDEMKAGNLDVKEAKSHLPQLLEIVKKHAINHKVPYAEQAINFVTGLLNGNAGSTNILNMLLNRNKKKLSAPERQEKRLKKTRRAVRSNLKRQKYRKTRRKKKANNSKKKKK